MWFLFGRRFWGRVYGYEGEYLETGFLHFNWLPIAPLGSRWVTGKVDGRKVGFDVKLSMRSVAAGYVRVWLLLFAVATAATLTAVGAAIAAVMMAVWGWTWTWRRLRGTRERRRAALNLIALGTACDPMRRPVSQCAPLRADVAGRFAEVAGGLTPGDVAQRGADSPQQAALAYASLRLLAATSTGATCVRARADSERILDRLDERVIRGLADAGPYRAPPVAEAAPESLDEATAASVRARDQRADEAPARPMPPIAGPGSVANTQSWWRAMTRPKWVVLGLALGGIAIAEVHSFVDRDRAGAAAMEELRGFVDDLCACPDRACADSLIQVREADLDRAMRTARRRSANHPVIDRLGRRLNRCYDALPDERPEPTDTPPE